MFIPKRYNGHWRVLKKKGYETGKAFKKGFAFVASYEALRKQKSAIGHGKMGLGLFIQKGMLIWMQAWSNCEFANSYDPTKRGRSQESISVVATIRDEVVQAITKMVWDTSRKEMKC